MQYNSRKYKTRQYHARRYNNILEKYKLRQSKTIYGNIIQENTEGKTT
jgi:hypothetical protein